MNDYRPHQLYRFYAADDSLLYVGITVSLPSRMGQHRDTKYWWHDVAHVTVEHYGSRDDALAAEKAAIVAECPRHNVVHNQTPRSATNEIVGSPGMRRFEFQNRHGYRREEPLWLYYEIHGDPITDNYYENEVSAYDLWHMWVQQYYPDRNAEARYGPGAVGIYWCVEPVMEFAPFQRDADINEDFLKFWTWPRDVLTGERISWSQLPVADKVWGPSLPRNQLTYTKGGFFQTVTSWKPAPLQPYVDLRTVSAAAGMPVDELAHWARSA